jgi:hypothetical protein
METGARVRAKSVLGGLHHEYSLSGTRAVPSRRAPLGLCSDDDRRQDGVLLWSTGVIAGVVFEDAIRKLSEKLGVEEKGVKLDALITELRLAADHPRLHALGTD